MRDRCIRARAEKLLLGTLVMILAVAAGAIAPRAVGQETAKPKSPDGEYRVSKAAGRCTAEGRSCLAAARFDSGAFLDIEGEGGTTHNDLE